MINSFAGMIAYASFDTFVSNVGILIINPLIILLFALATLFFLYGLFQFVMNAQNEEKRTEGKNHMLWGIIGLVIMMGVWTLLKIVLDTFNIQGINPEQGTVNLKEYSPKFPQIGEQ